MTSPIRLTAVLTHPVQYYAPWFRHIAANCPGLDLTVLYATQPTPSQQGVGFGTAFCWDTPLAEGYPCRFVRPSKAGDNVHSDRFWGLNVAEIGEAVRDTSPDVVLVPGWHSITLVRALWTCRRMGVPVLYRGDTNLNNAPRGWRRFAWKAKTRWLLKQFDGYLSVGRRTDEYFEHFGVSPSKVFRAPHFVDNGFFARAADPFRPPAAQREARRSFGIPVDDFVVLFIGKLEPKKHPLDAIRALAKLGAGATLLLVGSGPLANACRREADRSKVKVVETGFLNQSELGKAYAVSDCLVLPSDAGETWGLVVNEALATGLPCVVSDRVGCAPDLVVPGHTGEVFPAGDIGGLAMALHRIRQKTGSQSVVADKCRAHVDRYSFTAATEGLLSACGFVVSSAKVPVTAGGANRLTVPGSENSEVVDSNGGRPPRVLALCGHMVSVFGIERMTFEVLALLRKQNAAVHCVVNDWANHRIVPLAEKIGATWSTGYYRTALSRHTRNPFTILRVLGGVLRTNANLLRDGLRFRPTHILAPEFLSVVRNAPALALFRACGVRVTLRVGNAPDSSPFYRRLWRIVINPLVHRYICNSQFTLNELRRGCNIPASKSTFVYNTLPSRGKSHFDEHDPHKVVFVGQIIPPKGLHLLLDAVGLIASRGQEVRLDVIGDADGWEPDNWRGYRESLRRRAQQPDLAGRVQFLGQREDVPALMANSSIHCCPSLPEIREAFGLVTLEAKQAALPTVAFRTGAIPELISHQQNGWICSEVTAEALAEGLTWFLSDRNRCAKAGQRANQSLVQFSRATFAAAWLNEFQIAAECNQRTEVFRNAA